MAVVMKVIAHGSIAGQWQKHLNHWKQCQACPLHKEATHHCLLRGALPASVLFIGEAPGHSEDQMGYPFVGRSGKLLDLILQEVMTKKRFTYAITNTVACVPLERDPETFALEKLRPPSKEEMQACLPRVLEVLLLVKPRAIVYIGKVAESIISPLCDLIGQKQLKFSAPHHKMFHPAYILRKGGQGSLEFKRTVLQLQKFLGENL